MSESGERKRDEWGRFTVEHNAEFWPRVRQDYEQSHLTIAQMSVKHEVSQSTILQRAHDENWVRRRPRKIDPNDLVMRMLDLLDRQMVQLENDMNEGSTEVAMLTKVAATLDKVLLLKDRTAGEELAASSKEADELRARIAERIRELNRT